MQDIIKRWSRAAQRAQVEQVRILALGSEYLATSSSTSLGSYHLLKTEEGWTCECRANAEFGVPCKHLWALSEVLGLDVFSDMRLNWAHFDEVTFAA